MLVRAPARVNIIGEHTDYNDGLVLPTTTALYTTVDATRRSDRTVHAKSRNVQDSQRFNLDDVEPAGNPGWVDYVKGVAAELQAAGVELYGAELEIRSDIPLGGGLSSSASFELAIATALLEIAGETLPKAEIAKICQRAEQNYAGTKCGIMDQFTIACCERGKAMLLDCRSLEVKPVSLALNIGLLIVDSGIKHKLSDSEYNSRGQECAEAVEILADTASRVDALRDLSADQLEAQRDRLGDLLYRRCRHVVSENIRVCDAITALESGDIENLGKLISACHASLRDDFEVSCNEIEQLVNVIGENDDVYGSRMVGAGFGGCVLSLVESEKIDQATKQIKQKYKDIYGSEPWTHIVRPADPAGPCD